MPSRTSIAIAKSKSIRLPSTASRQERRLADRHFAVHGQVLMGISRSVISAIAGAHAVADRLEADEHLGEQRVLVAPVVGEQVGDAVGIDLLPTDE